MTELQSKNSASVSSSGEKNLPSMGDRGQNDMEGGDSGAQKAGADKAGGPKGKYEHLQMICFR